MGFSISRQSGDTVAIPNKFLKICKKAKENDIRVALIFFAEGKVDVEAIADELEVSENAVVRALRFWQEEGFLLSDEPSVVKTPAMPRKPRLTNREITAAAMNDVNVSLLTGEIQNIMGGALSATDTARIVSLYLQDNLDVEMILVVMIHFVGQGQRNISYIEKILRSWHKSGITQGRQAEQYLKSLEKNEEYSKAVSALLDLPTANFTTSETTLIVRWYEEYKYDDDMISAAILMAGDKKSVRYISGILKKWHSEGYKNSKSIPIEGGNIQPTGRQGKSGGSKSGILVVPKRGGEMI